jgi:PAS domain S-box-containing protein
MTETSFRRLLLRFALVPILSLCAFLTVFGIQLRRIAERRFQAAQATSVLLQSNRLLKSMLDEETGIRGYIGTRDPLFLQPYKEASARFDGELAELSALRPGTPSLSKRIDTVTASSKNFDAINRELLNLSLPNDAVVGLLKQQKQTMDVLRTELGDLMAEQNKIRESGRKQISSLLATLPLLGIGGGAFIVVLLVWHGIALFREITQAFSQQLDESEIQRDSLQTTLHSIGDAVIVCDSSGHITLMNPTAEELTGWKNAEAIGEPLERVFHIINEYTRELVESPVVKVLRHGQIVGLANHTLLIRRDGSEISIDDSGAPIRDRENEMVGVVLVFRDIEERRKAERELALRTAELESMLFHSPAGFASFDHEHRFLRVNNAFADLNGIDAKDHVGKKLQDIFPANASQVQSIIDHVFHERTAVQQELIVQTAEEPGIDRQWLTCFYPVLTEQREEPVSVGALVLETTDRWRAQESLVRSEKLVAVGRLAASIAHEMNNPLASVMNLLYLIAQDDSLEGETREYVDRANIELARASKIATQTLRFAKRSTAPSSVDMDEVASAVLLLFNGRITLHQTEVIKRIRGTPRFFGHANEMMQMLTNLVGNGLDAMRPFGRMVVSIQPAQDPVTGVRGIAIAVADSGSGIPEATLRKIWEPFFTTKQDTGTGLGLWLVDEMVKKNGGTIRFRTSTKLPRQGTTFRIFLPEREEQSR